MKIVITYKHGRKAVFFTDGDPLELDLDINGIQDMFSIQVFGPDNKLVFSAYRRHNKPTTEWLKRQLRKTGNS